ncbi:hypothetical protein M404DRAFT_1004737 [Pisolithus tinctorius Marx 270]|uniref:Uncharacterized protein n=1 Tax=Pisolithus tinctorius Marx 270 TaxID=870435 RepID=A0A0C3JPQ4_PISTI|nr:hypothetical protein M404DRAFT_1004737 [Pisolithus tinctorius Marx 270]
MARWVVDMDLVDFQKSHVLTMQGKPFHEKTQGKRLVGREHHSSVRTSKPFATFKS